VRRPGKTIILLLLVFILGTVIAGAISVEGAITNTDANLRRNMQPIVTVAFDWEALQNSIDWDNVEEGDDPWSREFLTPAIVREIGALPQVNFYDYAIQMWLNSFELEEFAGESGMIHREEGVPASMRLRGTSNAEAEMVQLEQGIINLVAGRGFEASELTPGDDRSVALVSQEFANLNNLSLNSTFEIYNFVFVPEEPDEHGNTWGVSWAEQFADDNIHAQIGMVFEVVGIYEVPVDPDADPNNNWERIDSLNFIYTPNWALEDIAQRMVEAELEAWDAVDFENPFASPAQSDDDEEREIEVTPIFVLEDPAYIEEFREAAAEIIPEFHMIADLSSAFDGIASSMETLQNIANWVLYVSVGATLLILSLLITLFLRDRRYEMGVYLALGEKKGRIVAQILLEVVVTSLVGITFSVFIGNIISDTVSTGMLRAQIVSQQNDNFHGMIWTPETDAFRQIGIPMTTMTPDEMMAAFDVSLGFQTIVLFYAVGLGSVVASTIIPVIYVVTLKPKKVLM